MRLMAALAVLLGAQLLAALAHVGVRNSERALLDSVITLPPLLRDALTGAAQLVLILVPVALVITMAAGRRFALVGHILLAGALGVTLGTIVGSPVTPGNQDFKNFNNCVRKFVQWANQEADEGRLDFVLVLGDLVDFGRTGLFDRTPDDSNWSTVIAILTGSPAELSRGNHGLRVPIFTSTGNHDFRTYPYSPKLKLDIFGITKACASELDLWYRNTAEDIGKKLEAVEQNLIRKGSPLLARSWWGAITGMGLRGFTTGITRLLQRTRAVIAKRAKQLLWVLAAIFGITSVSDLKRLLGSGLWPLIVMVWHGMHHPLAAIRSHDWLVAALFCLLLALALTLVVPSWLNSWLRGMLESLIAITAEVGTIHEYFLRVNPYFNYAFRVGNCHFIVLDTGPDCLTAQSFWDQGGKKIRNITINDNMIGGAPDSMGFYPSNEYYPYSQISWLENVLRCIGTREKRQDGSGKPRIFVGLHAPPANLSDKDRKRADDQFELNTHHGKHEVLMKEGRGLECYDIRYGGVNHYLSQFFYLCLGYRESQLNKRTGPGVDVVFAGHAHWNLEFELRKPRETDAEWSPELWYGDFSKKVEATCKDENARWGPLLLQTAAGGPASDTAQDPPNFRLVTVNTEGEICHLRPCILKEPQSGKLEAEPVDAAPARYKPDSGQS